MVILQNVFVQIKQTFPDTDLIKFKLNKLEKNLKSALKFIEKIREEKVEADVGMFTKKVMNHCASCESDLTQMLTSSADHTSWNKMPFRPPGENMAR